MAQSNSNLIRHSAEALRLIICGTFLLSSAAIAFAQSAGQLLEESEINVTIASDASERIALVSRLRTLSQQVAAASCTLTSGINTQEAATVLAEASGNFSRYLTALRDGDLELGILAPETDRKLLMDLAAVEAEWARIEEPIKSVLADWTDVASSHIIDDQNLRLLELTTILSTDTAGHYANPFKVTARDSIMIELAGRQLMLTQKMAKDSCEIWTDYNAEAATEDLIQTMEIFEASLNALRFGLPEAGISPAPNDVIRENLDRLLTRWNDIKANQQILVDGGTLNDAQKGEIFHHLQLELADLRHVLEAYRAHSERDHTD